MFSDFMCLLLSLWILFLFYICSRVNSCVKDEEHVLEELETEGERRLKSLLQHQLDTSVSIEEWVLICKQILIDPYLRVVYPS